MEQCWEFLLHATSTLYKDMKMNLGANFIHFLYKVLGQRSVQE